VGQRIALDGQAHPLQAQGLGLALGQRLAAAQLPQQQAGDPDHGQGHRQLEQRKTVLGSLHGMAPLVGLLQNVGRFFKDGVLVARERAAVGRVACKALRLFCALTRELLAAS
jgi:hypothetical protein